MRLLVIVLTLVLLVSLLGFAVENLNTHVDVRVLQHAHPGVSLMVVVILSVLAGILYAGIIGAAEGANIRFTNHRLRRQIRKLEAELQHARTQPPTEPGLHAESPESGAAAKPDRTLRGEATETPAAPVYLPGRDSSTDSGDDPYGGGQAT